MKIINLLNPEKNEIENFVEIFEREWKYSDEILYKRCIVDIEDKKISKIGEEEIKDIIKTFLINWGMMGRVLNNKKRVNLWQNELKNAFENCPKLEEFRKMKIEEVELRHFEDNIKNCYSIIRAAVGPTSASKTMHLLCPNFFPMWDQAVREKLKITENGKNYCQFMYKIKDFLNRHNETINSLSKKHGKSKLKIIDEYMWKSANS